MNIRKTMLALTGAMGLILIRLGAQGPHGPQSSEPFAVKTTSCQTIYYGYTPEYGTAEIRAEARGGAPPYRYQWQNGEIGDRFQVQPTQTTFYYVTVTDRLGREMTAVAVVEVTDVRCGEDLEKVSVCYPAPGKSGLYQPACVSPEAAAPILAAGGRLGPCPPDEKADSSPFNESRNENQWVFETLDQPPAEWPALRVYPNPAREIAFIDLDHLPPGPFTISLADNLGRVLLVRSIEFNGAQTFFLYVDDLAPGAYWISLQGSDFLETRKLIIAARG